ncbi:SPOR domain-containing protein [bacterium]|nr:SPOR domain-containing protein [bacterium]
MASSKPRFFIYDRREMGVLVLLAVLVALFAFTLGVHLGKRVAPKGAVAHSNPETLLAETVDDRVPEKTELNEQGKNGPQAADETMTQILHEEVNRTGIKLTPGRQVNLPGTPKAPNAGATTLKEPHAKIAPTHKLETGAELVKSIAAGMREAPHGKYTLQVGSHTDLKEAQNQVLSLEGLSMKPYLRAVDLGEKGRWYRIYLGGYSSRDDAMKAGNQYRTAKLIDSFVVANTAN